MIIEEEDFKLEYLDEFNCFDVYTLKVINAKDASKRREEFEIVAYGVSFESAMKRIINYRVSKKADTFTPRQYINEFKQERESLLELYGNLRK